jgi:hypothetical protein
VLSGELQRMFGLPAGASAEEEFASLIASIDPDDLDVLFFPDTPSAGKEIGVTGNYAYWRYEVNGLSGIAGSDLPSHMMDVIVRPNQVIRLLHVGRHAVFQYGDGSLWVIAGGSESTTPLGGAPVVCDALASDALNVYCRAPFESGSAIYAWPVSGADAPSIVHVLPSGSAFAIDPGSVPDRFYFSDDLGAILSAPQDAGGDGSVPSFTTLANSQTSPRAIAAGVFYVAWIDVFGKGFVARSELKVADSAPVSTLPGSLVRYIAVDQFSNEYWVGIGDGSGGGWQINRVTAGTNPNPTFFRSGNTDLGGLAVDSNYVYWTRSNGRVYRAPRDGGDGPAPPPPGH